MSLKSKAEKQIVVCPHCREELTLTETPVYQCTSGHTFDLAKEGYLNLLQVNRKKSKEPGDNQLMITGRRVFLDIGFYSPLAEAIYKLISETLEFKDKPYIGLDAGCGEGYYTQNAFCVNHQAKIFGTDISKVAVKRAAKKHKEHFFFVSSVYHLPVAENCCDLVLSVFSPIHAKEFYRVLKNKGYLIVVGPAENHMKQLAQLIYDEFKPHEYGVNQEVKDYFSSSSVQRVSFPIHVKDGEILSALHKMTPYYYHSSKESQERVANCSDLQIDCDFYISVFQKIEKS